MRNLIIFVLLLLAADPGKAFPRERGAPAVSASLAPADDLLLQIDTLAQATLKQTGHPVIERPVFTDPLAALENLKKIRRAQKAAATFSPIAPPNGITLASPAAASVNIPFSPSVAVTTYDTGAFSLLVNGEKRGEYFVLLKDGDVYLEKAVLDEAGFAAGGREVTVDGTVYTSLASRAPGITFVMDDRTFQLSLSAEIGQFRGQVLNMGGYEPEHLLRPDNPSAFINYGVELLYDPKLGRQSISIPHESGIRYRDILLFSSYSFTKPMHDVGKDRYVRLYSSLVKDDPERMVRYTLGDFNAYSGVLGGGTVMGGFSVARNFGMNPYFIRTSGLSITGAVETSSEVEVYRNGSLLTKRALAPGFFDLQNMPLMDGSGDVTLVIKDAFGRENRIDMPYTFSQEMLRKGVQDFSYSIGLERRELGNESASYKNVVGVLRHRAGMTDHLTLGVSGEFAHDVQNAALSATATVPWLGTIGAAAAMSWGENSYTRRTQQGHAYRVSLTNGFPLAGLFYSAAYSRSTPEYATISLKPFDNRPLQSLSGSIGIGGNRWGSVSLFGSLLEASLANGVLTTVGVRYSVPVFKWVNLTENVSLTRDGGRTEWTSGLTLTSYLGKAGTASVAVQRSSSTTGVNVSLQKTPESEQGLGYQISGQFQEKAKGTAGGEVSWYGTHGIYSASYQSLSDTDLFGVKTSGSIATLFDGVHFSRPVYDSFAVIKVDNLKDVPVYLGGRMVGITNEHGEAFAPLVSSYGINPFMVRQFDLPFNYTAPVLNKALFPAWRSGSRVVFDVDKVQAVRGNIAVVEAGGRMPADFWVLTVNVNGREESAPLLKDGEFYLENIPSGSHRAEIAKDKKRCSFVMEIPKNDEAMIELGQLICTTK